MFIIRFEDGLYNSGYGFAVSLRGAEKYETRELADGRLSDLTEGTVVELSTFDHTDEDLIARTIVEAEKLLSLLKDPHPGLFTWNAMLHEQFKSLAALFETPQKGRTTEKVK